MFGVQPAEVSAMPQYRVMVAGSRSFDDDELLRSTLDRVLAGKQNVVIVSGGAKGADRLGERHAQERGLAVERHKPDWKQYGRGAGMVRDGQMIAVADHAVFFWDGASTGTADGIAKAEAKAFRSRWCDSRERERRPARRPRVPVQGVRARAGQGAARRKTAEATMVQAKWLPRRFAWTSERLDQRRARRSLRSQSGRRGTLLRPGGRTQASPGRPSDGGTSTPFSARKRATSSSVVALRTDPGKCATAPGSRAYTTTGVP